MANLFDMDGAQWREMLAQLDDDARALFLREASRLCADAEAMFRAFENRRVYPRLTEEVLAQTPDEELVLTVFDTLAAQSPPDLDEAGYLAGLSPQRRAAYMLYILAGEVDNGGFNQYYYNTGAEAAAYLPDACELIGAPEYADLVRRANACYLQSDIAARHDGSLEAFCASYENNPLADFDDEFYLLQNRLPLEGLLVKFIRAHTAAFAD
ncbi:MAG: DUF4375 domain-containing protein [Neisseria sp.]|nr:DUF4375 domain-containing protein [Neisseria sp.]